MTQVKMLISMSGTRDGEEWPKRGELLTVRDELEAADLVAANLAVTVDAPVVESAAVDTKPAKRAAAKPEKRG